MSMVEVCSYFQLNLQRSPLGKKCAIIVQLVNASFNSGLGFGQVACKFALEPENIRFEVTREVLDSLILIFMMEEYYSVNYIHVMVTWEEIHRNSTKNSNTINLEVGRCLL